MDPVPLNADRDPPQTNCYYCCCNCIWAIVKAFFQFIFPCCYAGPAAEEERAVASLPPAQPQPPDPVVQAAVNNARVFPPPPANNDDVFETRRRPAPLPAVQPQRPSPPPVAAAAAAAPERDAAYYIIQDRGRVNRPIFTPVCPNSLGQALPATAFERLSNRPTAPRPEIQIGRAKKNFEDQIVQFSLNVEAILNSATCPQDLQNFVATIEQVISDFNQQMARALADQSEDLRASGQTQVSLPLKVKEDLNTLKQIAQFWLDLIWLSRPNQAAAQRFAMLNFAARDIPTKPLSARFQETLKPYYLALANGFFAQCNFAIHSQYTRMLLADFEEASRKVARALGETPIEPPNPSQFEMDTEGDAALAAAAQQAELDRLQQEQEAATAAFLAENPFGMD